MTVPMADVPAGQRPRERLWAAGDESLSDAELVALLLRHGRPGESALEMAASLLSEYGGLPGLAQARPEELAGRPGIGAAKAAAVVAAFRLARRAADPGDAIRLHGPADVARAAWSLLADARRERVVVLVCDARNRLSHRTVVAEGSIDRSPLPVRDVLNIVLRRDGCAFAIAHNHPSGELQPSAADLRATSAIARAARAVGLRFLDHVVVAGGSWVNARPVRRALRPAEDEPPPHRQQEGG
jgi:DNA repair protein RadC